MKSALFGVALLAASPVLAVEIDWTQHTFNAVAERPQIIEDDVVLLFNNRGVADGLPVPGDVAPVPEPGEWAMIVAGLGVVGFVARRRKANA